LGEDLKPFATIDRGETHSVKYEAREKLFGSKDVIPLWVADMDIASPFEIQQAIAKRASHPIYGYTTYPLEFFNAISYWTRRRYNWEIEERWIVPSCGVVPSINFAIEAYTKIGEGVIVQPPIYPPFFTSIKAHGRKLLENKLIYKDGKYSIDFEDFEAKAKVAKLFLLASPHNPTTKAWSKDELSKMVEICQKYGIVIVSDEIHADIIYKGKFISIGSFGYEKTLVLNAPSKTFNIAGLKTSYAIIKDRQLRIDFQRVQKNAGVESGNPFGIEALIVAYTKCEPWLEELKAHLFSNITTISNALTHTPISPVATEATFLMWLDCHHLFDTHEEVLEFFYKKAKLGLSDGASFGIDGERFMRLNVAISQERVGVLLERLKIAFGDYQR